MKSEWLKNISFTWLIQGHLTKDQALKISEVAKSSIDHKALELDDIQIFKSMVKLPD